MPQKIFDETGNWPIYKDLSNIQYKFRKELKKNSDPESVKKILEDQYGKVNLKVQLCLKSKMRIIKTCYSKFAP